MTRLEQLQQISEETLNVPIDESSVKVDVYRMLDAQISDDFLPIVENWREGLISCAELFLHLAAITQQPAI